ncbi:MAG: DUF429 domain-containing protein [ANME-2 cluster archaeon]|nr:DUF429 domain-containing protein [ANME-2 cluster archaeon]
MNAGVFIGVDLGTSTKRKSTGVACIIDRHGTPWIHSLPEHIISEDTLIHGTIARMSSDHASCIVAIDAPLSRPDHGSMRDCEKRLRKHGIPCYPSGAKWVQDWVDKGIELKGWCENTVGTRVIEIYPYAARRALDIGARVKKKSKEGRRVIQKGLCEIIGGMNEMNQDILLSDDELDAIIAAYTAYCVEQGNFNKMDGFDGAIYIPLKMADHTIDEYQPVR